MKETETTATIIIYVLLFIVLQQQHVLLLVQMKIIIHRHFCFLKPTQYQCCYYHTITILSALRSNKIHNTQRSDDGEGKREGERESAKTASMRPSSTVRARGWRPIVGESWWVRVRQMFSRLRTCTDDREKRAFASALKGRRGPRAIFADASASF